MRFRYAFPFMITNIHFDLFYIIWVLNDFHFRIISQRYTFSNERSLLSNDYLYWVFNMTNTYERLRSASALKSASTHQIGIHWRHYVKSRSSFPYFKINDRFIAINSTSFSERWFVCAFILSHDGCGSKLYVIGIAYYIKWMQNVKVPEIKSPAVRFWKSSSPKQLEILISEVSHKFCLSFCDLSCGFL